MKKPGTSDEMFALQLMELVETVMGTAGKLSGNVMQVGMAFDYALPIFVYGNA